MMTSQRPNCRLLVILLASILLSATSAESLSIIVVNSANVAFDLYWINPTTDERSPITWEGKGILPGKKMDVQTYVDHEFEVREIPSRITNSCDNEDQVCRSTTFVVTNQEPQFIVVQPNLEIIITDSLPTVPKANVTSAIQMCQHSLSNAESVSNSMDSLTSCIETTLVEELILANQEVAFQSKLRTGIAEQLENYTCVDDSLDSSPDISSHEWVMPDATRVVHIKHDRPSSQIHVIENFINEDECLAMEAEAAITLHRATVADGKGGSRISANRKAMQAGITVKWDKEAEGDLIARLSRRVYDYTNYVLNLDIKEHGQEDLMSIQYFGRGRNDTEPDRYTPHCDGDCTGLSHKPGTRMATMVMYCTLPSEGGSTNFRNSGVHIKPVKGNAIFFSYINPTTKVMDKGFTEHSGCPVYEGEKKIVTQWIRYGVDLENPWDSFNTLGIKRSLADEQ